MASFWNPAAQAAIRRRLEDLSPDRRPLWGSLTAPKMLCHLGDQVRVALGHRRAAPLLGGLFGLWPLRWLAIHWLPIPRGAVGPPEMFVTQPTTWEADLAALFALLDEGVRRPATDSWGDNPFVGPTTKEEWGVPIDRHIDHHLQQFAR